MEEADEHIEPSELFRELLRIFPTAKIDDYYKNGLWKVDTILIDTELIEAHRIEAGAPEPPSLDEIQLPELPGQGWLPDANRRVPPVPPAPAAPVRVGAITPPKLSITPPKFGVVTPKPPLIRPPGTVAAKLGGSAGWLPKPKAAGMVSAGPAASPELKLIAAFIAEWKVEATKTKLLLARLTPANRKLVMEGFSHTDGYGRPSATEAFEKYVQDFERGGRAEGEAGKRPSPSDAFAPDGKRPRVAVQAPKRMGVGGSGAPLTTPKSSAATTAKAPGSAGIGAVPKGKASGRPPVAKPGAVVKLSVAKPPPAKPSAPKPVILVTESRRGREPKAPEAAPGQLIQNLLSAL